MKDNLKWKLVRASDQLTKYSDEVKWLEWYENGAMKDHHNEPMIGTSLLMSPFNPSFTWQTTEVTEIMEKKEDYIKFKTRNSVYELYRGR